MMFSKNIISQQGRGGLVCLALVMPLVAGCASSQEKLRVRDAPLPLAEVKEALPCRHPSFQRALGKLKPGCACWFIVQAGVSFDTTGNGTGLLLEKEERYRVDVFPKQFWYDKTRQVPAPQGDTGGGVTKYLGWTKHHSELCWFALMATGDRGGSGKPVYIGQLSSEISDLSGELRFYVNDTKSFYGNNQGRILIKISRMTPKDAAASPPSECRDEASPRIDGK
ncbi:hypothetical protein [Chromobacterium sp. Beijing]|uniref:hypothetical protein n=1 Tax=Chromobacterium sp. Beijing TaxID=2735795 RepID=UPI001F294017|nr:hypothetical protein [Chromobacterium sp. Beijing]UJB30485.1 hypothetical protein HQN78_05050 [Chromobacterium sp. Beijing]